MWASKVRPNRIDTALFHFALYDVRKRSALLLCSESGQLNATLFCISPQPCSCGSRRQSNIYRSGHTAADILVEIEISNIAVIFSSKCIDNVTPTAFGMKFQNFDTGTFCRKETNLAEIRYSPAE